MFAKNFQIRLPRRITAYFLLFGLAALVSLALGAVYVASSITDVRSESAALRSLGRGSDKVTLAFLRNKGADLQQVILDVRSQSGSDYCAIVAPTGEYLAHSNVEQKGKSATEAGSVTERWGEIHRVEYLNEGGATIHEYRCPLKSGDQTFGVLRLGMARRDVWSFLTASAEFVPLAFFGPACC